jgi:hypothetical protein
VSLKIYVAGPMTGLPGKNLAAFDAADRALSALGYVVINPARHDRTHPGAEWRKYMRLAILDVMTAQGVALLPGWESSRGAKLEWRIADALGIPAFRLERWLQVEHEEVSGGATEVTGA